MRRKAWRRQPSGGQLLTLRRSITRRMLLSSSSLPLAPAPPLAALALESKSGALELAALELVPAKAAHALVLHSGGGQQRRAQR